MANEGTLNLDISVLVAPNPDAVGFNIFRQLFNVSGVPNSALTKLISHTADTALDLGGASGNCGYMAFRNLSATDRIFLKLSDGGSNWADLGPGQGGVLPIPAAATPYARAQGSADVYLKYVIYQR